MKLRDGLITVGLVWLIATVLAIIYVLAYPWEYTGTPYCDECRKLCIDRH